MTHDPFKYAKFERERRFLVASHALPPLSEENFLLEDLDLTGTQLRLRVQRRHFTPSGGPEWGFDVAEGALDGLVLAEREFDSEAELHAAPPPEFAACAVSDDAAFTGGALAHAEPTVLLERARELLARIVPANV